MASLNKVLLIGRAGKDPEVRVTATSTAIAAFSLATGRSFKNKQGVKQEETEWHSIVAFGRTAEFCRDYLCKGALLYVEGKIRTNQWEDREGNRRQKTEIIADTIELLESKKQREAMADGAGQEAGGLSHTTADDEIPF